MSKRNFILLIIVLIIVIITVFGFLYLNKSTNSTGVSTSGTNFFSQFNPFSSGKTTINQTTTSPTDVSGYQQNTTTTENTKLKKISSMPIAGFTVFNLTRLKDIPVATPTPTSTDSTISTDNSATTPSITPTITTPTTTTTKKTTTKTTKPTPPLTELALALRYVARVNGNVYETFADKIMEKQYTSTVIPKVYDAYLGNNGQSVVMRYLKADGKTIETFFGTLPKEILGGDSSVVNEIKGSLLADNTEDISLSPDAGSIFYLFNSGNNLVGTTLNLAINKKVQIFSSPFTEWLSWWPNSKVITLTTKPSASVPGYMYTIDQTGKNFSEILGNINGLTTLTSPNGKLILYADNNLALSVYHKDTNVSNLLGVKTLPEKCVWNSGSTAIYCAVPKSISSGQYPDAWYQGEVSFSDAIWKVDPQTGNATLLIDPITISGGEEVDGIKLALDSGENYLFFVNKKDSYLWEFGLK